MSLSTSSTAAKSDLPQLLDTLGLAGICLTLIVAFYYELPCPLCLLQRVGLVVAGFGFMFNLQFGAKGAHYGIVIVGALTTAMIGARQVLLHILPGDPGYGSTFLGLHFYSCSLISALLIILAVALILMVRDGLAIPLPKLALARWGRMASLLFVLLIAANLISTVLECGAGQCADNPVIYELLSRR
ncbi:disulfide bond formation protein B [Aeromonas dhakensis]|uniref:disulfide bond formation protein B n=1 Tax=Aeromonas dhakensis TaxID=196024 RepID=UPI00301CB337